MYICIYIYTYVCVYIHIYIYGTEVTHHPTWWGCRRGTTHVLQDTLETSTCNAICNEQSVVPYTMLGCMRRAAVLHVVLLRAGPCRGMSCCVVSSQVSYGLTLRT